LFFTYLYQIHMQPLHHLEQKKKMFWSFYSDKNFDLVYIYSKLSNWARCFDNQNHVDLYILHESKLKKKQYIKLLTGSISLTREVVLAVIKWFYIFISSITRIQINSFSLLLFFIKSFTEV
jgi:hypothetical protein